MDKQELGGFVDSDGDLERVIGDRFGVFMNKMKLVCEEQLDIFFKSKGYEVRVFCVYRIDSLVLFYWLQEEWFIMSW